MTKPAEAVLVSVGLVLLVVGYRRNAKRMMLAAAICLLFSGNLGEIVRGYQDGYEAGRQRREE